MELKEFLMLYLAEMQAGLMLRQTWIMKDLPQQVLWEPMVFTIQQWFQPKVLHWNLLQQCQPVEMLWEDLPLLLTGWN